MSDNRRPERSDDYWSAVEADYRSGMRLQDMYSKHDCTKAEFDRRRRVKEWPLRNEAPVNRQRLVTRLLRLVNRHVKQLEAKTIPGGEKDVALLHQLVATIGKLVRYEAAAAPIGKRRRKTKGLVGIREKLVQRIEELKRS